MEGSTSAACYIRVSTEDQTEYSPDAQRKALEAYAAQHGFRILPEHIYLDAGISGRKAAIRPAFLRMVAAAKEKPAPFSVILVHKFDRFARSREDSIVYKSMLRRQCGVQVISVTEQLEDDRMGIILEAMLEAMAEYYSVNLAEEVRKGMTEKARRGELQTSPPFGYRAENHHLTPIPGEAAVVRELYRRFLEGESIVSLSRWSAGEGVLSHRGNPLDSRGIRYILKNPVYTGKLCWGTDEERILTDGDHPAIIEQDTFAAAQNLLKQRRERYGKHAKPGESRRHWLAGLVRCAACGRGMVFSQQRYLRCGGYVKGKCRCSQHIRADILEQVILSRLRQDTAVDKKILITPIPEASNGKTDDLRRRLRSLEKKVRRLREAYLCGAETAEEYRTEKAEFIRQETVLRRELERAEQRASMQFSAAKLQAAADQLICSDAPMEAKYRAACAVFSACIWDKAAGAVRIIYRLESND